MPKEKVTGLTLTHLAAKTKTNRTIHRRLITCMTWIRKLSLMPHICVHQGLVIRTKVEDHSVNEKAKGI